MNLIVNVLSWAVIGLSAGWLGCKAIGSKAWFCTAANISMGLLGAMMGGCLSHYVLDEATPMRLLTTSFAALSGAALVLWWWKAADERNPVLEES